MGLRSALAGDSLVFIIGELIPDSLKSSKPTGLVRFKSLFWYFKIWINFGSSLCDLFVVRDSVRFLLYPPDFRQIVLMVGLKGLVDLVKEALSACFWSNS